MLDVLHLKSFDATLSLATERPMYKDTSPDTNDTVLGRCQFHQPHRADEDTPPAPPLSAPGTSATHLQRASIRHLADVLPAPEGAARDVQTELRSRATHAHLERGIRERRRRPDLQRDIRKINSPHTTKTILIHQAPNHAARLHQPDY